MHRILFVTSIFFLVLPACVKSPPQTAANRQAVDAEVVREMNSALNEISQNQANLDYLSTYAQVSLERGKQRRSFDAVLQVAAPNRLSLQVLNDLGQEVASVVADGENVLFHDAQSGQTRRFPQNGEALRKTLKLPITVEDLVDRILLKLPPSEVLRVEREISPSKISTLWVVRGDDEIRLDLIGPRLNGYEAKASGKPWRYRVDYSRETTIGNRKFPQGMAISFRKPSLKLTLNLQQIAFAPPASRSVDSSFDTNSP